MSSDHVKWKYCWQESKFEITMRILHIRFNLSRNWSDRYLLHWLRLNGVQATYLHLDPMLRCIICSISHI